MASVKDETTNRKPIPVASPAAISGLAPHASQAEALRETLRSPPTGASSPVSKGSRNSVESGAHSPRRLAATAERGLRDDAPRTPGRSWSTRAGSSPTARVGMGSHSRSFASRLQSPLAAHRSSGESRSPAVAGLRLAAVSRAASSPHEWSPSALLEAAMADKALEGLDLAASRVAARLERMVRTAHEAALAVTAKSGVETAAALISSYWDLKLLLLFTAVFLLGTVHFASAVLAAVADNVAKASYVVAVLAVASTLLTAYFFLLALQGGLGASISALVTSSKGRHGGVDTVAYALGSRDDIVRRRTLLVLFCLLLVTELFAILTGGLRGSVSLDPQWRKSWSAHVTSCVRPVLTVMWVQWVAILLHGSYRRPRRHHRKSKSPAPPKTAGGRERARAGTIAELHGEASAWTPTVSQEVVPSEGGQMRPRTHESPSLPSSSTSPFVKKPAAGTPSLTSTRATSASPMTRISRSRGNSMVIDAILGPTDEGGDDGDDSSHGDPTADGAEPAGDDADDDGGHSDTNDVQGTAGAARSEGSAKDSALVSMWDAAVQEHRFRRFLASSGTGTDQYGRRGGVSAGGEATPSPFGESPGSSSPLDSSRSSSPSHVRLRTWLETIGGVVPRSPASLRSVTPTAARSAVQAGVGHMQYHEAVKARRSLRKRRAIVGVLLLCLSMTVSLRLACDFWHGVLAVETFVATGSSRAPPVGTVMSPDQDTTNHHVPTDSVLVAITGAFVVETVAVVVRFIDEHLFWSHIRVLLVLSMGGFAALVDVSRRLADAAASRVARRRWRYLRVWVWVLISFGAFRSQRAQRPTQLPPSITPATAASDTKVTRRVATTAIVASAAQLRCVMRVSSAVVLAVDTALTIVDPTVGFSPAIDLLQLKLLLISLVHSLVRLVISVVVEVTTGVPGAHVKRSSRAAREVRQHGWVAAVAAAFRSMRWLAFDLAACVLFGRVITSYTTVGGNAAWPVVSVMAIWRLLSTRMPQTDAAGEQRPVSRQRSRDNAMSSRPALWLRRFVMFVLFVVATLEFVGRGQMELGFYPSLETARVKDGHLYLKESRLRLRPEFRTADWPTAVIDDATLDRQFPDVDTTEGDGEGSCTPRTFTADWRSYMVGAANTHRYGICSSTWLGYDVVDFAIFAKLGYYDPTGAEIPFLLQMLYPGEGGTPEFELRQLPAEVTRVVPSFELYSRAHDTSVVVVRGTDVMRADDLLEDVKMWAEPVLLTALSVLPTVRLWSTQFTSLFFGDFLDDVLSWFGLQSPPSQETGPQGKATSRGGRYYGPLVEHVAAIAATRRVIMTGHSLGGGLARIVSGFTNTTAVAFSPPGVVQTRRKFRRLDGYLRARSLYNNSVSVVPERDPISMIDSQSGFVQYIMCRSASPVSCHSVEMSICELLHSCGDRRQRFDECVPSDLDLGTDIAAYAHALQRVFRRNVRRTLTEIASALSLGTYTTRTDDDSSDASGSDDFDEILATAVPAVLIFVVVSTSAVFVNPAALGAMRRAALRLCSVILLAILALGLLVGYRTSMTVELLHFKAQREQGDA